MTLPPVVSIKLDGPLPARSNEIQSRLRRTFRAPGFLVKFEEYEISYDYGETWTGIGTSPEYYPKDWRHD